MLKIKEVELQGLEYMNDDPSQVAILYAKIQRIGGGDVNVYGVLHL